MASGRCTSHSGALLIFGFAAVGGAACGGSSDLPCVPGSTQACLCVGGSTGVQRCISTGTAYDDCICDTDSDDRDVMNGTDDRVAFDNTSDRDALVSSDGTDPASAPDSVLMDGLTDPVRDREQADDSLDAADVSPTDTPGESPHGACGNGLLDKAEFCDPSVLQRKDCRDVSGLYVFGVATCTDDCHWDLGECERYRAECGNGLLEPGEECELSLNRTASCASISNRFVDGDATCTSECRFETSACVLLPTVCGDGMLEGEEECDEGDENGSATCSIDCRAIQNGQYVKFESPTHVEGRDLSGAFMRDWACNTPATRSGWRNGAVADVKYEIHICQMNGSPILNLSDVRAAMTDVQVAYSKASINLVESASKTFSWPNCRVDFDNSASFDNMILGNTADDAIAIALVSSITSKMVSFAIGGYSGPESPIVNTAASRTIFAHEIGHRFGLAHPFACSRGIESADNCSVAGDMLCDTPPDHGPVGVSGLERCADGSLLNGTCDCNGRCTTFGTCTTGESPDCSNAMSYYHCWPGDFSNGQLDFMRCSLENELRDLRSNCIPQTEVCNGKDDDCDGKTDETLSRACGSDVGECEAGTQSCSNGNWETCVGAVGAGIETCNGLDDDCDGQTDENLTRACGSNVGECRKGIQSCRGGSWDTPCFGGIEPRPEVCDGRDNDCDGSTDEGINWMKVPSLKCPALGICAGGAAYPVCSNGHWGCHYPNGYMAKECPVQTSLPGCDIGDPNDSSCSDGKDNDCDGVVDDLKLITSCQGAEEELTAAAGKRFGDGCWHGLYGLCASGGGTYKCVPLTTGCGVDYDCVGGVYPDIAERCDGLDHNCNGKTYDRNDLDSDGYGDCGCDQVPLGPNCDCNESSSTIHPGATEVCNGQDDDCDGNTDGVVRSCLSPCGTGIETCTMGVWQGCTAPQPLSCINFATCTAQSMCVLSCPPTPSEVCNFVDDDCDGAVDEEGSIGCTSYYLDSDGDGYGAGSPKCLCRASSPYIVNNGLDCCDSATNVFPGATEFHVSQSSCGSWDYDCDGVATKEFPNLSSASCPGIVPGWAPGWGVPECGVWSMWYVEGCRGTGGFEMGARTQGCR